jgi:hypothetical protein
MPISRWDRRKAGAIADQTASLGVYAPRINRRNRLTYGQCYQLLAMAFEKRISLDDHPVGAQLGEGREGGADLAFAARLQDRSNTAFTRAASCISRIVGPVCGKLGLTSRAITLSTLLSRSRPASRTADMVQDAKVAHEHEAAVRREGGVSLVAELGGAYGRRKAVPLMIKHS